MKLFNITGKDIGIDLGTSTILITVKGKGIVLSEPCAIAIDTLSGRIIGTGFEAYQMLGRTPAYIKAVRPLKDGVIADFTATRMLLKHIISKLCVRYNLGKPRAIVGVPYGITEVEERAVEEAILSSGAREVLLIEEPMAAAIGANLDVAEPTGNIIVDIGGGTTEASVVSLGGIVVSSSIKVAGDELNQDIVNYCKRELGLAVGEVAAEEIKKELAYATEPIEDKNMEIKGRDYLTGLPKTIKITADDVSNAIKDSIRTITDLVKQTLEKTPPELSSDIATKGINVCGGGALIHNIDKLLSDKTGMPVNIVENPMECVVKGTEKALDDIEHLREIFLNSRRK